MLVALLLISTMICVVSNKLLSIGNGTDVKEVWVLNLDRRTDRLESISNQLNGMDLQFTRFPVIDGHYLKHKQFHKLKINSDTKFNITRWSLMEHRSDADLAEVSTWQTHLQVYFRMRESVRMGGKDDPVMILEDDAVFGGRDARRVIENAGRHLPTDWELFFLGYKNDYCLYRVSSNLCRAKLFLDLTGYIVRNASTAEKLISYANKDSPQTADIYWIPLLETTLKVYLIRPKIITPLKGSHSDIQPGKINGVKGD